VSDLLPEANLRRLARTLAAITFAAFSLASGAELRVAVRPLGQVDPAVLRAAVQDLTAMYDVQVRLLPSEPMPPSAYYRPRNRYRAEKLLDSLEATTDGGYDKVLGITAQDISTSRGQWHDWGVFGLGRLSGRSCVVSTCRMGGGGASRTVLLSRLAKVVDHEFGHTLGLPHCTQRGCLMEDMRGSAAVLDACSGLLCASCQARASAFLRHDAHAPARR